MMAADRFWRLGGMDEKHGSWGQMGTEVACKSWLSGGRQVVNRRTWFAHLFRTQPGFKFPYHITDKAINEARDYSQKFWRANAWSLAQRPLEWLTDYFRPVPGWHDSPELTATDATVGSYPTKEVAHVRPVDRQ